MVGITAAAAALVVVFAMDLLEPVVGQHLHAVAVLCALLL